ncbi:hypothetical protein CEXT_432591 [Caerostris extrusa]|uniref:Uncharacterized protein n=1 Tax=Caerostris extrusa TaxID=172846 RepID=A0AAV4YD80_CAEEX|nr:hypothetical protein CEXT_432591 [Caerostris extrusa]
MERHLNPIHRVDFHSVGLQLAGPPWIYRCHGGVPSHECEFIVRSELLTLHFNRHRKRPANQSFLQGRYGFMGCCYEIPD